MPVLSQSICRHLLEWKERPWPLAWSKIFAREAPLVVEVGFGNGAFLAREARLHPEHDHLGIELSWASVTRLFKRLEREGIGNVRVLLAEAELALGLLFESESIEEIFVNHPCPWPKSRHEERRLVNASFLALCADRLRPDGRITLVTDHVEHARWIADALEAQSALVSCHATTEVAAIPDREATKYERKALAQGLAIHYFEWRRSGSPARLAPRPAHDPQPTMPSLTLHGRHDPKTLFDGFETQTLQETHREVELFVKLTCAYRQLDQPHWLVETLVKEAGLHQEFGIQVVERSDERLLLKLSNLGRPHPTHGVKRALWCLAEWLRQRHPELTVEHHNLGDGAG